MSRAAAHFRQADLTRALKAVDAAGVAGRYKIVADQAGVTLLPIGLESVDDLDAELQAYRNKRDGKG